MAFDASKSVPFGKFKGTRWDSMFDTEQKRDWLRWVVSQQVEPGQWEKYTLSRNSYLSKRLEEYGNDVQNAEKPHSDNTHKSVEQVATDAGTIVSGLKHLNKKIVDLDKSIMDKFDEIEKVIRLMGAKNDSDVKDVANQFGASEDDINTELDSVPW